MQVQTVDKSKYYFTAFLLYLLLGASSFYLFHQQALNLFPSDLTLHLSIIDEFIHRNYTIPHPAFHLLVYACSKITGMPYSLSAPLIMSAFFLTSIMIVNNTVHTVTGLTEKKSLVLWLSILISFATAIYLPFFNPCIYLGQWSPNIWHNPQILLLKPLAVISFFLYFFLLENNGNVPTKNYVVLSLALLTSVVMKPSFVFVFFPAIGLYLLSLRPINYRLWGKTFLMMLPSLAMLGYQYAVTYRLGTDNSHYHDKIIFTNFGVLKLYTPSIVISALLVLAFPLSVVLLGDEKTRKSSLVRLAWCLTVVSFLQFAFLAEEQKFDQAAFAFGYDISLFILFLVSLCEYLTWYRSERIMIGAPRKYAVASVLSLHVVSGTFYFGKLLLGGSYF